MDKIVVIYHKNCLDGTASASLFFDVYNPNDIYFLPLAYNYQSEELYKFLLNVIDEINKIYVVDFSLKKEDYQYILNLSNDLKIITIDHHKGIQSVLSELGKEYDNFVYYYDINRSGAGLTYDFLEIYNPQVYEYIKYIQDRDIWKWEFGRFTKTLTEYLFTKYLNKPYQLWVLMNKVNAKEILSKYKVVTTHTTRQIQNIFDKMKEDYNELYVDDEIGNVKVFNSSVYPSELGNMLSDLYKEPVGIYSVSRDKIKISFRSTPESNFTALEIAKKLGGGGHEHASGVIMTKRDFIDRLSID